MHLKKKKKEQLKRKVWFSEGVTEKSEKNCRSVNPYQIYSATQSHRHSLFKWAHLNGQIGSSAVNLSRCSQQWAPHSEMVNLIIENPLPPFFIFIDKVALCWSWQQVQSSAPHDGRQRSLSIRNGVFVWSQNHCLSLNLSEVDANEASGSVRLAKKKLITAHPLPYSTIKLSIIL